MSYLRLKGRSQDKGARDLSMFMDASLVMLNRSLLDDPDAGTGARLYVVGAAEALARRHRLGPRGFRALANNALSRLGEEHPLECLNGLRRLREEQFAHMAWDEGRAAAEAWLAGEQNAPLRLAELAAEWRHH